MSAIKINDAKDAARRQAAESQSNSPTCCPLRPFRPIRLIRVAAAACRQNARLMKFLFNQRAPVAARQGGRGRRERNRYKERERNKE